MTRNISALDFLNVERGIKNFLTYFECFDKTMREEIATPTWITSYNFVCLLNLPTMLATFGPLRNYWEGGGMGEKIIQHIKPLWNRFRKHWQLHLVEKLLKKMAIDRIQLHSMGHSGKNDNYIKEGKQFHSYNTKDEVYIQFNTRQPMSIIHLENGYYLIAITKNTMCT